MKEEALAANGTFCTIFVSNLPYDRHAGELEIEMINRLNPRFVVINVAFPINKRGDHIGLTFIELLCPFGLLFDGLDYEAKIAGIGNPFNPPPAVVVMSKKGTSPGGINYSCRDELGTFIQQSANLGWRNKGYDDG
ncbi:MAG: hypothetical protein LBC04_02050 [Holosporaceae bacterium]|jgi:hypothetical protein|nr:hypothetical protein [Holosporaceae bacterium]